MRFNDDTTLPDFLRAVEPELERLVAVDELAAGQECFGAACAFAEAHPDSQTASDLLAWAHGSTPGAAVENARAESMEEWIAPEDMAAYEEFEAAAR